ncbi:CRP-like cAMP-binding protein [Hoeflea marina]|uniref:CRP-like cAMP-binding protein n=1 Tax=Hoeflea marina TaxID=274592 RepID=A0A317PHP6_9HYPH|nr:Crp/Fnr family transcriptional regulator [Hoeflea marina]PWV99951.1 CRP-like cAMP-binding protein [Hoeflea marina]
MLSDIALFEGMPPDKLAGLARQCSWANYSEHELVVDFADDSTDVRFIISGGVRVIFRAPSGKEMILGEIGEGQFFGELAAIDGQTRSANVTTLSRSRICTMPAGVFRALLAAHPDIALKVMTVLTGRIRSLNMRLAEHSFLDARFRLYNELIRLSRPRSGKPDQRIISPPPNQSELAERIGCRREVVSREIARLKGDQVVEITKGGLVLSRPETLSHLLSEAWAGG